MRTYNLSRRTINRIDKNGVKKTWTSKTFYISYYEKRKKIWIDTGIEDEEEASKFFRSKIEEIEGGTVYQFLKKNHWLEETRNPLYVDSRRGAINYHLQYAHSLKNVRYLQIILEDIKDPIGDCIFVDLSRKDVLDFKDRLDKLDTYIDAQKRIRKVTSTFRNGCLNAFSTIWSYYLRTGKVDIKTNPFLQVEKFKKNKDPQKKYIFTPEDYRDIFDREILESIEPISYYKTKMDGSLKQLSIEKWHEIIHGVWIDFFEFIFLTGCRGSEAAAITIDSFEPNSNFFLLNINKAIKAGLRKKIVNEEDPSVDIIGDTKTSEKRQIVLCNRARDIVEQYADGKKPNELLFTVPNINEDNKYSSLLLSQNRAYMFNLFIGEMNAHYNFVDDIDNEVLTLHGARTSMNTNLLLHTTLRESLIAAVMGWTSHSLTNTQRKHYTKYGINDLIDVAKQINRLYLNKEFSGFTAQYEQKDSSRKNIKNEIIYRNKKSKWIDMIIASLEELRNKPKGGRLGREIDKWLVEHKKSDLLNTNGLIILDEFDDLIGHYPRTRNAISNIHEIESGYNSVWDNNLKNKEVSE